MPVNVAVELWTLSGEPYRCRLGRAATCLGSSGQGAPAPQCPAQAYHCLPRQGHTRRRCGSRGSCRVVCHSGLHQLSRVAGVRVPLRGACGFETVRALRRQCREALRQVRDHALLPQRLSACGLGVPQARVHDAGLRLPTRGLEERCIQHRDAQAG
jgi:hypothetical protein